MGKRSAQTNIKASKRLGQVLKQKRERQALTAYAVAQASGQSRSYISYLESGRFGEVGVDKFSRVVAALGVSADEVLQEAGYLPKTDHTRPDPKVALRDALGLTGARLEQALDYAEYLANKSETSRRTKK